MKLVYENGEEWWVDGNRRVKFRITWGEADVTLKLDNAQNFKRFPINLEKVKNLDIQQIVQEIFNDFDKLWNCELLKPITSYYDVSVEYPRFFGNRLKEVYIEKSKGLDEALSEYEEHFRKMRKSGDAKRTLEQMMKSQSITFAHKQVGEHQVWVFKGYDDRYIVFISNGKEGHLKSCSDVTSLIDLIEKGNVKLINRYRDIQKEVLEHFIGDIELTKALISLEGMEHVKVLENCIARVKIKNM